MIPKGSMDEKVVQKYTVQSANYKLIQYNSNIFRPFIIIHV